MWPFTKKEEIIPTIKHGNITAKFDTYWKQWTFSAKNINFVVCNISLDLKVLDCIDDCITTVANLKSDIDKVIQENLDGWSKDWQSAELVDINLTEILTEKTFEVSYGSDSWQDLGIDIIIKEGKIIDSFAGD